MNSILNVLFDFTVNDSCSLKKGLLTKQLSLTNSQQIVNKQCNSTTMAHTKFEMNQCRKTHYYDSTNDTELVTLFTSLPPK